MKKVVYGVLLVAVFGLAACGNDKKENSSSSKVEQLESRVKELESSSSAEEPKQDKEKILSSLMSDTNKKIAEAFLDNDLDMFNNENKGVFEAEDHTMYFSEEKTNPTLYFTVSNYDSLESLNSAYEQKKEENHELYITKNDNLFSLMIAENTSGSMNSEQIFNKYKKVFEKIQ